MILTEYIGVPTSGAEIAILYALAAITFLVVFDTIVDLFYMVGASFGKLT